SSSLSIATTAIASIASQQSQSSGVNQSPNRRVVVAASASSVPAASPNRDPSKVGSVLPELASVRINCKPKSLQNSKITSRITILNTTSGAAPAVQATQNLVGAAIQKQRQSSQQGQNSGNYWGRTHITSGLTHPHLPHHHHAHHHHHHHLLH